MIKIIIADSHRLFREALALLLESLPGAEILALCGDSREVIDTIRASKPDLIFLDVRVKPLSVIAAIEKIRQFSTVKIIGLSMYSLPSYATNIFNAGANGFITRNSSKDEIFRAIDTVMKGRKYLCEEVRDLIVMQEIEPDQCSPHSGMLTAREIQVAQLLSKGHCSREIALALNCTNKTVEVHRHHMLRKLKLKNTSELVNFLHLHFPDILLSAC